MKKINYEQTEKLIVSFEMKMEMILLQIDFVQYFHYNSANDFREIDDPKKRIFDDSIWENQSYRL